MAWTPERDRRSRDASRAFARRSSVWTRMLPRTMEDLYGPGRKSLQWSVVCSAFAIIVPALALGGIWFALRCRRANGDRWRAALAAACWCAVLGVAFRHAAGLPAVP
jgi:hypothetical protein